METKMPNIYIEARPKARSEGSAVEDLVEDRAAHVHLIGGQFALLEEAAADGVGPQLALGCDRAADATSRTVLRI